MARGVNPFWRRQLREGARLAPLLALPLGVLALAAGGSSERWIGLLSLGWAIAALVPVALNGRPDAATAERWRSASAGAGDRWSAAYLAHLPIAIASCEIAAAGAITLGPAALRGPWLLLVAAVVALVWVAFGLAAAAWSRTSWQLAGWLGWAILLALAGAGPVGHAIYAAPITWLPFAQVRLALLAVPHGAGGLFEPLGKLAMAGLLAVVVGVVGYARR